ncbi:methylmalonate-semialdehyde dehydrogenase (CoA acylating) [Grimontia hollisae]|uniref:methylmalonate-semialdehyde dehydrogenase (CoA acylating) n=2 Tax=Grimontia hollisae TaxID=673 RepID=D0I639_GRIHO|nr:CoA-acylating methylmalonate-semialdehyde dehydrogenase [Grimontia hollisae]AMG29062.1 methylmalonate-semialdehyde dehydrogenase (CoA acylating) [Grimontia hollisae]EEY73353.1 methylmalonate-semialdehyde dehydrogenase [Grimontia hollisae CIP 101886]MDF2186649.1 CoA-acylating methylmalonate-semialdehyde dehydrogenase [Grimontia hollisae]STO76971.1 Methylmalonate-semialdehyde dehydrogenase [acylating] [Grimontia hollisae]STO98231.1 Methylmalonate-semialdehyde dehydrogenase [acylating] [Grimon
MNTIGHLINGALITEGQTTLPVYNPATGAVTAQVDVASTKTVNDAVRQAKAAYPAWRNTPPIRRARIMQKFLQLLQDNADTICEMIGREHGKIKHDAMGELQRGIENVEYACSIPNLLKGEHTRGVGPGIDAWSEFQPLGVVAGITPFNFPVMVPLWMYPLAIACGNCFILKPSERDPSSTLFVAQLLQEAGLPPGVMNVVNGDKATVDALLENKDISAVSFVGSTPVAQSIYTRASAAGKRCQALGGAKNHAIVMPDADLDNAVSQLLGAAFGSSGERCMALSVVTAVGEQTADTLVTKLKEKMAGLRVGGCNDNSNDFGPVITEAHRDRVNRLIGSAETQGAEVVVDGRNPLVSGLESGFFVGATLIDRVTPEMESYQEEIFGPVLQVVRVDSMAEAMQLINDHEYGNGTCIFTRDGEAARYFSDHIDVGMVGINVPLPVPVAYHSFGGWKRSFFGDLSAYGPDGVRFYTRRKTITQRWPSEAVREGVSFSMPVMK